MPRRRGAKTPESGVTSQTQTEGVKRSEKFPMTLQARIVEPLDIDWDMLGHRLRAMRRTVSVALNKAQQDVYYVEHVESTSEGEVRTERGAMAMLRAIRAHKSKDEIKPLLSWQGDVEKKLREHWNAALKEQEPYDRAEYAKAKDLYKEKCEAYKEVLNNLKPGEKKPKEPKEPFEPHPDIYSHVPEYFSSETADSILTRWTGEPLKELLAGRASVPSFKLNNGFFVRGRNCDLQIVDGDFVFSVTGLFPGRTTRMRVKPCGNGHAMELRRLIRDAERRQALVDTRDKIKEAALASAKLRGLDKSNKQQLNEWLEMQPALMEAEKAITQFDGRKFGRVGFVFDEDKNHWKIHFSTTQPKPAAEGCGTITAAVNLNVHNLLVAVTDDGDILRIPADAYIGIRKQHQGDRKRTQENMKYAARAARGHGYKRFQRKPTAARDVESDRVRNLLFGVLHRLYDWCVAKKVRCLYWEDFSGLRESFEKKTEGEAAAELKRYIHNFPYYEATQIAGRVFAKGAMRARNRRSATGGVAVPAFEVRKFTLQSQKCPDPKCGHTSPGNIKLVDEYNPEVRIEFGTAPDGTDAKVWTRQHKRWHFLCEKCRLEGDGDVFAAVNNVIAAGGDIAGACRALYRKDKKDEGDNEVANEDESSESANKEKPNGISLR